MSQLAVRTTELTKRYHGRPVLSGVSVRVQVNEVYGLIGLNGAGKTTLLCCLAGLIRATAGQAEIFGHQLPREYPKVLATTGLLIGRPAFYPFLTGSENLVDLTRVRNQRRRKSRVREVLTMVGLAGSADQRFGAYSEGMRQRLALAAALLFEPELVLLDEPTEGLDPKGVSDTRRIIYDLRAAGATVVFSSHALGEVEAIADHIGVIHQGRLIAEATPSQLIRQASGVADGAAQAHGVSDLEMAFLSLIGGSP